MKLFFFFFFFGLIKHDLEWLFWPSWPVYTNTQL